MVNTKGGFLLDDGKKVDEELRRKEKEREKQRDVHNLDIRGSTSYFSRLSMLIFSA